jgi:hypothetical protein
MTRRRLSPRKLLVASVGVATLNYLGAAPTACGGKAVDESPAATGGNGGQGGDGSVGNLMPPPNPTVANLMAPPFPTVANLMPPPPGVGNLMPPAPDPTEPPPPPPPPPIKDASVDVGPPRDAAAPHIDAAKD